MQELRKNLLLIIGVGFGSALFSLVTLNMYSEPAPSDVKIVLAARPPTTPKESLARRSQREGRGTAVAAVARPALTPTAAPSVVSTDSVSTPRPDSSAASQAAAPVTAMALTAPRTGSEKKSVEEVPTHREKIWGEWQEVQDFRHGVLYRGQYENFIGHDAVPSKIRRAERAGAR